MAAETNVLIKIGFSGGSALAGLGSVDGSLTRIGSHMKDLTAKQKALGDSIQKYMGVLAPASLRSLNDDYERLGRRIEHTAKLQSSLAAGKARGEQLRTQRMGLRSDAMDAIGLGATALIPVKLAMDFESAMADVRKVVDFDTPDGFEKLTGEILKMSRVLPLSLRDLAQIAASGGQLGVAAKDIPAFVEQIAKMSTAFDMAAEDAGDSMAKLANVYDIPIRKIGALGDAINALSNESPAKASDIVRALSRVGGVAKQFGLSETQAASLSSAFISLGKQPEVAGTAINGLLAKLMTADKQGAKFQKSLSVMGLSASGLKKSIGEDAQGALVGFLQRLEKVPAADRMGVLVDMFGLEYADDVAVLAGSVKTYTQSIEVLSRVGKNGKAAFDGSMDKEFQIRAKTTANNWQLLKNGMSEMGVNIGSAVLPALNDLMTTLRPLAAGVAEFAKNNRGLVSVLMQGVGMLVGFKVASIGVRYGLNLVLSGVNSVKTGFTVLRIGAEVLRGSALFGSALWLRVATGIRFVGTALLTVGRALLLNPIGLAITGIALGAYLIYRNWGRITAFFKDLWSDVKAAANGGVWGITKLLINWTPIALFYNVWKPVLAWFGVTLPAKFTDFGGMVINGLVGGIMGGFTRVKDAVLRLGSGVKNWFADALGIKSPSRVFMGFGANIGEGAQLGIMKKVPSVAAASGKLAQAARGAMAGAALAGGAMGAAQAGGGGMTIHYSPQITVQGGAAGGVEAQVQKALGVSQREFETMLNRVLADRQRRGY